MRGLLILGAFLIQLPLYAQEEELGEAQGLPDEKATEKTTVSPSFLPEALSERSYLWLEAVSRKAARGDWQDTKGPNGEVSATLAYKISPILQSFIDGRLEHDADPKQDRARLEQVGLRYEFQEHWLAAIGKERSRKAPGLILAPSDFLYAQENLPGQREQRSGLWQARLAWQVTGSSVEALVLPYDQLNEHGLPDGDTKWNGWALRGFHQFANFDLQAAVGHLADGWHEGVSTQGIMGAWKIYAEAGWRETTSGLTGLVDERSQSSLAGWEYQGWDKWSLRAEYFQQTPAATREDLARVWNFSRLPGPRSFAPLAWRPFLRERYAIASVSALGLRDKINLFATLVRGLDDRGFLFNQRGEWLVDDHQVIGMSMLALSEGDQQQYALRPFDRQLSLDWKFTF